MDCEVIRDLLPLYADDLLSDGSRAAIEAHAKTCPGCKSLMEQICAPLEPEPADEAQAVIDAMQAQKRKSRRRIIIACVATALVCILGWWIYMETHFIGEKIVTVSTDEAKILAEMPDLALTGAEKELAGTILEFDGFREALNLDSTWTEFDPEAVREYIAPILPENAELNAVAVLSATVNIDYRVGDMRTIIEYTDDDLTGHMDTIRKYMAYSPYEYINGVEFAGDVEEVYMLTYAVGCGLTRYEKTESQHIWFGFLDWP